MNMGRFSYKIQYQPIRDCPINRTCRLIAHSTSDFDDRLQFHKIDYFKLFEKNKLHLEIAYWSSERLH